MEPNDGKKSITLPGESSAASSGPDAKVSGEPVNRLPGAMGTAGHTITIAPDKNCKGEFVATKATFVHRGDHVQFENLTGGQVDVQFNQHDLFDVDMLTLTDASPVTGTVGPYARNGDHPFAAYCHKNGQFARGGSMPIIIVEPKSGG